MVKKIFILVFCFYSSMLSAQMLGIANGAIDSMQVVFRKDKWVIEHIVRTGDNVFLLSHRYHVPPALLTDINGIDFQKPLPDNSLFYIPIGSYNLSKGEPSDKMSGIPLFFVVGQYDNLFRIANLANATQKKLQDWNGLTGNKIVEGQRLFVGWMLFDTSRKVADTEKAGRPAANAGTTSLPKVPSKNEQTVIIVRKGKSKDTIPEVQKIYLQQTKNELTVTEEKGPAVFFENKGKLSGTKMFFALHNGAAVGTIIKVYNPGTDRTVYVKVIGKIPDTKTYHNCIIGIGAGAKDVLMVTEEKAWCELKFAPSE